MVRCDLDVPLRTVQSTEFRVQREVEDDTRLRECLPTIKYLLEHGASVVIIGHLGRPDGNVVGELKMEPVRERLAELLGSNNFTLLENLRFDPREESNDPEFSKELASLGDFYVNEAFAASHREHSSIVGIPKLLPHCAGFHFASEVENLSKVLENPKTPLVFVIGGAKPETKLPLVSEFAQKATWVLVGGTLVRGESSKLKNIIFADLTDDSLDISKNSAEEFIKIIKSAGTVVWNGPMGKYEDEKSAQGTKKIAEGVAEFEGFSVVGGGDTIAALKKFELLDKIDYVSTGGGAMLEFLAKGTLPGIKALF